MDSNKYMQNKYFTHDQFQTQVLDHRPQGAQIKDIVDTFVKNGYTIQGVNDKKEPNLTQNILGSVLSAPGNLASTALAGVGAVGEYAGKQLAGTPETLNQAYQNQSRQIQNSSANPLMQTLTGKDVRPAQNVEQLAGDVIQTGALLAPGSSIGAGATSVAGKIGAGALNGAIMGGGLGTGNAMSNNGTTQDVVNQGVLGAGIGGFIGGAIPAVAETYKYLSSPASKVDATNVVNLAKNTFTDVANKQTLNPLLESSRNNLVKAGQDPAQLYQEYYNAQKLSTGGGSVAPNIKNQTALEKVGNDIGNAFDQVIKQRQDVGAKLGDAVDTVSNKRVSITSPLQSFLSNLSDSISGKQSKFTPQEEKMLENFTNQFSDLGTKPTVGDLNNFVTRMTSEIKATQGGMVPGATSNAERIINGALGDLRDQIAIKYPVVGALKSEYSTLSDLLDQGVGYLGKQLPNGNYAKDTSVVKSSLTSILNGGKKDFLIQLEDLTGQPLLDKAVIAGQAMADAGDARGSSLLQLIYDKGLPSKSGLLSALVKHTTSTVADKLVGNQAERTGTFLKGTKSLVK